MLDDDEYGRVMSLTAGGRPGDSHEKLYGPMLAEYERITGYREMNPNAISHHRICDYGPPCSFCGKPLRTPRARICGSCMKLVRRSGVH